MIVVDASVVMKLLTREQDASLAVERVSREPERTAPDWLYAEVASALSKKVRYGGLSLAFVDEALASLPLIMPDLVPSKPLLRLAIELSVQLRHAIYDCMYLAVAMEEQCTLLTADHKFATAVSESVYRDRVEMLA